MSHHELCAKFKSFNITCTSAQWLNSKIVKLEYHRGKREYLRSALEQALAVSSIGKIVLTDRLHGTVVPYLAQIGVVYIESISKNIKM